MDAADRARLNARVRRAYAAHPESVDRETRFDRMIRTDEHRAWCCDRTVGACLEVAIGTGMNLPHYPAGVALTGIDLTPELLARCRRRAAELGRAVELHEGDAQELPFADHSFDTVVCTWSMCSIPDPGRALEEMRRVLRPAGRLVMVDHVASTVPPLRWLQRAADAVTGPLWGEYWARRPFPMLRSEHWEVVEHDRLHAGVVERFVATPAGTPQ